MCFNSYDLSQKQQNRQNRLQIPKNAALTDEDCLVVGSRILESDRQIAVHFSQDLNHFSVGQNRHRPPNNIKGFSSIKTYSKHQVLSRRA
jgi:hypothetical protein